MQLPNIQIYITKTIKVFRNYFSYYLFTSAICILCIAQSIEICPRRACFVNIEDRNGGDNVKLSPAITRSLWQNELWRFSNSYFSRKRPCQQKEAKGKWKHSWFFRPSWEKSDHQMRARRNRLVVFEASVSAHW